MITTRRHLEHLVEEIFGKHLAAALVELARTIDDEIEERVRNRVDDLRQQLERGAAPRASLSQDVNDDIPY